MSGGNYAGFVDDRYPLEGFYVRTPKFMRLAHRLARLVQDTLEQHGYEPVLFPTLIPEHVVSAEVSHIAGFEPAVYWVTETGRGNLLSEKLALAISSETIFALLYRAWLDDGAELPLRCYQQRSVFRAEQASVEPLLREREFLWFEAHTAFASEGAAYEQIEIDSGIALDLADRLGLPVTQAERDDADKCPGALRTWGFDAPTPDGRLNQIASTHLLGQRFAQAFDLRARGDYVHQTSFGIGLSRLVAAVLDHNPQFGESDDLTAHRADPGHATGPILDEGTSSAPPA